MYSSDGRTGSMLNTFALCAVQESHRSPYLVIYAIELIDTKSLNERVSLLILEVSRLPKVSKFTFLMTWWETEKFVNVHV